MVFTRIPCGASSLASDFVKAMIAAFADNRSLTGALHWGDDRLAAEKRGLEIVIETFLPLCRRYEVDWAFMKSTTGQVYQDVDLSMRGDDLVES